MENYISLLGLVLDVIGFTLLYKYGLYAEFSASILGSKDLIKQNTVKETKEMKGVVNLSKVGFWLVIFGFIFQSTPTLIKIFSCNKQINGCTCKNITHRNCTDYNKDNCKQP